MYRILYLSAIVIVFSALKAQAQNIEFNSDSLSYSVSDTTLTGAKSDLHRKAQGWVIDKFKDAKEAIRLDDMDTGELAGRGTIPMKGGNSTSFNFKISSRDRGYACDIFDIGVSSGKDTTIQQYDTFQQGDQKMQKTAKQVDASIRSMLKDLATRMRSEKDFSKPSPAPLD